ncbi:MAG: hypothetical protein Q8K79_06725 [Solirubrobacteraceae bacterium]|nr:hypothetical protein [Solirubrobacteraceae bacterium]
MTPVSSTIYTVTATTGIGDGTLGLNLLDDDTIVDAATNPLGGAGAGNGSVIGPAYTLDKTGPVASSITRVGSTPTNAGTVSWTVTFSEAVTGVGPADFALARTGGVSGGSVGTVTLVSGTTYTVTASTGTGSGALGLNLVDDDTITDTLTNPLGGIGAGNGPYTGQVYTLDKSGPTAAAIARVGSTLTNAGNVNWTVTFDEAVTGVTSADFALVRTGTVAGGTISPTIVGSGTTYTVSATTGTGNGTLGLNLLDDDTIIDALTNPLGGVGTGNGLFTGETFTLDKTLPAAPSSLAVPNAVVWTSPPTCTGVTTGTRYINGEATSASASTVAVSANVTGETGLTIVFTATSGTSSATSGPLAAAGSSVSTSLNLSTFPDAAITVTAYTTDAAGNASTSTNMGGAPFIKDTVDPTLTASFHSIGGGFLNLGPHVDGSVSDCGATIVAEKRPTPGLLFSTKSAGTPAAYDIDPVNGVLVLGLVSYSVTATDRAGNVSLPVIT